jgi:hypothetical protein
MSKKRAPVHVSGEQAYKGYLIRLASNGKLFIEKDGFLISWPASLADAKRDIDLLTNPGCLAINPRNGRPMRVQSLLFDKRVFTARQATGWAHSHGFKYGDVEIPPAGRYIHLRQLPPRGRIKRIIPVGSPLSGIRAIVMRNPLCC